MKTQILLLGGKMEGVYDLKMKKDNDLPKSLEIDNEIYKRISPNGFNKVIFQLTSLTGEEILARIIGRFAILFGCNKKLTKIKKELNNG